MEYKVKYEDELLTVEHSRVHPDKLLQGFMNFLKSKIKDAKINEKHPEFIGNDKAFYYVISYGTWERYAEESPPEEINIFTARKALTAPKNIGLEKILEEYARELSRKKD